MTDCLKWDEQLRFYKCRPAPDRDLAEWDRYIAQLCAETEAGELDFWWRR